MKNFAAGLAVVFATWPLSAWILMLIVGVVHAEWIAALPPIGYGTSLLLCVLAGAYGAFRVMSIELVKAVMQ